MAACNFTSVNGVQFQSDKELANVDLFQYNSKTLLQFASACCVIFMLIGIPGNLTTIVALARCKKVRNATAIFIINLHVSNLIFNSLILPMTAITFAKGHWTHGWVMCRLYAYFKFVLSSSSVFTMVAISLNRYFIVCHPMLYPKLYKRRNMTVSILMIWASSFALFLAPSFEIWGRFDLELYGGSCTLLPNINGKSPKKFLLITALVVPCLTIALCYARIWCVGKTKKKIQSKNPRAYTNLPLPQTTNESTHLPLQQTQADIANYRITLTSCDPPSTVSFIAIDSDKTSTSSDTSALQSPREDKALEKYFKAPFRVTQKLIRRKVPTSRDRRLCAMIAAIMFSFCSSHLPVMAMRLAYKEFESEPMLNVFSHLLLFTGTCMNPIIYVLMSKEYRQAYQSLFEAIIKSFGHRKLSSSW